MTAIARLVPRSLHARLLALSLVATLVALVVAAVAIGGILERFVTAGLDDRLDAQIAVLAGAVNADGSVARDRVVLAAPYADPASGWGWRIDAPGGHLASPAPPAIDAFRSDRHRPRDEALRPRPRQPFADPDDDARPHPFEWRDEAGEARHGRQLVVATGAGPATILAAAPRAISRRPIRAAMVPLIGSLAILGALLALASLVQLRLGLRPLARLQRSVAAVRAGEAERLPDDQPDELAPLAGELNALVAQNAARLAQARGHVANLAHGLKTPLATLALAVREPGRDPDHALQAEVARIDAAIRHHLGRARADAGNGPARPAVPLAPAVAALGAALARIHADRRVVFTVDVDEGLVAAIDPQDLDELLGNLLDNGWRWASSRVRVTGARDGGFARIVIADDGPGIPAGARAEVLAPGRRLDESGDGHGFGLSIARELIELNGGALDLVDTPGGGLSAIVRLPANAGERYRATRAAS